MNTPDNTHEARTTPVAGEFVSGTEGATTHEWVTVPREPTPEMMRAVMDAPELADSSASEDRHKALGFALLAWKRMLAAAPHPVAREAVAERIAKDRTALLAMLKRAKQGLENLAELRLVADQYREDCENYAREYGDLIQRVETPEPLAPRASHEPRVVNDSLTPTDEGEVCITCKGSGTVVEVQDGMPGGEWCRECDGCGRIVPDPPNAERERAVETVASDVRRFDPKLEEGHNYDTYLSMSPSPDGEWVRLSDYERVVRERDEAWEAVKNRRGRRTGATKLRVAAALRRAETAERERDEANARCEAMRKERDLFQAELSLYEPHGGDPELLQAALRWLGIAGPAGKEELRARWSHFAHALFQAVANKAINATIAAERASNKKDKS